MYHYTSIDFGLPDSSTWQTHKCQVRLTIRFIVCRCSLIQILHTYFVSTYFIRVGLLGLNETRYLKDLYPLISVFNETRNWRGALKLSRFQIVIPFLIEFNAAIVSNFNQALFYGQYGPIELTLNRPITATIAWSSLELIVCTYSHFLQCSTIFSTVLYDCS